MASSDATSEPHWVATGITVLKGVTYELSASGTWHDASIPCRPKGYLSATTHTHPAGVSLRIDAYLVGSFITPICCKNAITSFSDHFSINFPFAMR